MEEMHIIDGEIMTEDIGGDIPSPDSIDGLIDHTITIDEKDPTVPEWAKQPNKPEYTYEEITDKPSINEVTVEGRKELEDYGVNTMTNMEILELFNRVFRGD